MTKVVVPTGKKTSTTQSTKKAEALARAMRARATAAMKKPAAAAMKKPTVATKKQSVSASSKAGKKVALSAAGKKKLVPTPGKKAPSPPSSSESGPRIQLCHECYYGEPAFCKSFLHGGRNYIDDSLNMSDPLLRSSSSSSSFLSSPSNSNYISTSGEVQSSFVLDPS